MRKAIAAWAVLASVASGGCSGFGSKQALPPVTPMGALAAPQEKSALTKATEAVVQPASKLKDAVASAFAQETPPTPDDALSLSKPIKYSPSLCTMAAQMHERSGNLAGAAEQYQRALSMDPNYLDALLGMARLHDRQSQFADAEKYYTQAVRAHPDQGVAHNDLGLCLARQGKLDQAARSLAAAVQRDPQKKLYRNNLATVLVHLGRPDDALRELQAVHPPAVAHYNVGYLLAQIQQPQAAQKHFDAALTIDPNFAPARQWVRMLARQPGENRL